MCTTCAKHNPGGKKKMEEPGKKKTGEKGKRGKGEKEIETYHETKIPSDNYRFIYRRGFSFK